MSSSEEDITLCEWLTLYDTCCGCNGTGSSLAGLPETISLTIGDVRCWACYLGLLCLRSNREKSRLHGYDEGKRKEGYVTVCNIDVTYRITFP